ncbi:MAG: hypothetical protein EOO56_05235 [Hymenobacter sp.]|nr:MAG: hypothetical protein EOO56_05235 [Hymenobacter sp.]
MMVSLSFSFDGECPPGVKEEYAIHLIDGLLQIQAENGVFVKNEHVPLIELALWLSEWLESVSSPTDRVFSFFPDSFEAELFQLAPLGGSRYQLAYLAYEERETTSYLIADGADFELAFTEFISSLAQALQQHYSIRLENILRQFSKPEAQQNRTLGVKTGNSFFR